MARALAQAGHEVHVLTQQHARLPERSVEGVCFHLVQLDAGLAASEGFSYFPQRWAVAVHEALCRLHAAHPFQAIEFPEFFGEGAVSLKAHRRLGAFPGAVLAVRLHTPSVLVRELNGVQRLDGEAAAIDVMERDSLRDADLVLSPTRALLELSAARFGPFTRSAVVPHPFSVSWASDLGNTDRARAAPARILYFGRLERRKGVQLLLPALSGVLDQGVDAELVFLGGDTPTGPGETSMRQALERAITPSLRGRVRFEPSRSRSELGAAISGAAVCCFPSLWENFPNVCLEAMAAGCPVVASDAGGMAELLEDGRSGVLFRSGNAAALSEALVRVLTDGASSRLVDGGRARLEAYCAPPRIVASLEEVLVREGLRAAPRSSPPPLSASPRVSVVVPFFNLARTLSETLASLEAQTFRAFETILVDDGSTEPASLRLLEAIEREGRLRVVRKLNGGLSSARNAGLAVATGDYVLPLDADDALEPSFLAKTVEVLEGDPTLAWCTAWVRFFSDETVELDAGWIPLGHAPELMLVENVAGSCTALFRRTALAAIGGYDESFPAFEDWEAYCSLLELGFRGEVLPEFLFRYRIREGSLAHGMAPGLRHSLRAKLIQKHPGLVCDTTLRRMLAEAEGQKVTLALPRYALADRVNATVKRLPGLHRVVKRMFER